MIEVTAQEAEKRLRELLQAANLDPAAMTPAQFWPVWKAFAREDYGFSRENDADGLLFEYFVPNPIGGNPAAPLLSFVRQFTYNDDAGVYDHMEQMRCEFHFAAPLDDPDVGSVVLWSFEMPLDDYFAQVENLPVFRAALQNAPISLQWAAEEI